MNKEPLLKTENLSVCHGRQQVVRQVSFAIEPGEFIGIVGPNGSGKTTLLRAILGLLPASYGTITRAEGLKIGYIPQRASGVDPLFPISVREVVAMGLPAGFSSAQRREKADAIMKKLQIDDLARRRIGLLSGGQQQRAHLGRALASDANLLVLDEPVSALDPAIRDAFYSLLHKLADEGTAILMVSHDVGAISKHVHKLLYLDGMPVFFGSRDEFFRSPEVARRMGIAGGEV